MLTVLLVAAFIFVVAAFGVAAVDYYDTLKAFKAAREVTCPAERRVAQITVDAHRAARAAAAGKTPDLRVNSCSLWPERCGCSQSCLHQIEPGHIPLGNRAM